MTVFKDCYWENFDRIAYPSLSIKEKQIKIEKKRKKLRTHIPLYLFQDQPFVFYHIYIVFQELPSRWSHSAVWSLFHILPQFHIQIFRRTYHLVWRDMNLKAIVVRNIHLRKSQFCGRAFHFSIRTINSWTNNFLRITLCFFDKIEHLLI